jgi:hypothetical protein
MGTGEFSRLSSHRLEAGPSVWGELSAPQRVFALAAESWSNMI